MNYTNQINNTGLYVPVDMRSLEYSEHFDYMPLGFTGLVVKYPSCLITPYFRRRWS